MIAIECVSASRVAVPPLLVFKAKNTNAGWIKVVLSYLHFSKPVALVDEGIL